MSQMVPRVRQEAGLGRVRVSADVPFPFYWSVFSLLFVPPVERKGGREDRGGGGEENIEGLRD